MIPVWVEKYQRRVCTPRASGDDPRAELELVEKKLYSPRKRG